MSGIFGSFNSFDISTSFFLANVSSLPQAERHCAFFLFIVIRDFLHVDPLRFVTVSCYDLIRRIKMN